MAASRFPTHGESPRETRAPHLSVAVSVVVALILSAALAASPCAAASPSVDGGKTHTAVVRSDETLWTWGDNSDSQLGYDTATDADESSAFQSTFPQQVGTETAWIQVAAGDFHTLALRTDGRLFAWGSNGEGQLGIGADTPATLSPMEVPGGNWLAVAAGSLHSVAVRTDGTLWAWGNNNNGQLGLGTKDQDPHPVPQQVGTDADWVAVAAAGYHTLALKRDGSLWAWGDNDDGQLGLGVADEEVWEPTRVGDEADWAVIASGLFHSLAIRADGSLWAWGSNEFGQLGLGTADTQRHLSPQRVGSDRDWVAIAGGAAHSLAVKADGSLWAWGGNQQGQLGYDTATDADGASADNSAIPQKVGTETDWALVAAGETHSLGVKRDGTLWAWGENQNGQLGTGNTTMNRTPAQAQIAAGEDTTPPTVVVSPEGGSFRNPLQVTVRADDDTPTRPLVFYTTDGSKPSTESSPYTGPVEITPPALLRVLAVDAFGNSVTAEARFTQETGGSSSGGGGVFPREPAALTQKGGSWG